MLGRPLRASGLPAPLAAWLLDAWSFVQHAPPPYPYRLDIRAGPSPDALDALPVPGAARPHDLEVMGLPLRVWVAGEGFVYASEGGALRCVHTPEGTAVHLAWPAGAEPPPELVLGLHLAISEGLRLSGLLPLHASAAVRPGADGGACAFLGPSGRGKTTTLLRALLAGWTPLAEDIVWLDLASGLAYGWDRALRLLPDSLRLLPAEIARPAGGWPVADDGKAEVPLTAFGAGAADAAPLTALALLERAPGQPSEWAPWNPRLAVPELWEACGLPLSAQAQRRAADLIGQVARQIPLRRLRLGDTPLPL